MTSTTDWAENYTIETTLGALLALYRVGAADYSLAGCEAQTVSLVREGDEWRAYRHHDGVRTAMGSEWDPREDQVETLRDDATWEGQR